MKPILLIAALCALLGGCAAAPATDGSPINHYYHCDRNGTQEQQQAC